jgi:flagellar assembly factor FliW
MEEIEMEDTIYYFPQGIPGFEDSREFRLVEEGDVPLAQLISVEDEKIGFILMRPGVLFPDYSVDINDQDRAVIKLGPEIKEINGSSVLTDLKDKMQAEVWAIVTLDQQDMAQTTLNLRAPILLNTEQRLGVQLILSDDRYLARQPLVLEEPQVQEGVAG